MASAAASVVVAGKREVPWKWVAAGTLAVAVAIGGWALKGKIAGNPASKAAVGPQVSLAILPFRNGSGDAQLDWLGGTLPDMLSADVGESAQLRTISSGRLNQVLSDLRISAGSNIDPTTMGRIAEFSNADTVVWGQYAKFGEQIRIDATLRDLKNQRAPISLKVEAANEKAAAGDCATGAGHSAKSGAFGRCRICAANRSGRHRIVAGFAQLQKEWNWRGRKSTGSGQAIRGVSAGGREICAGLFEAGTNVQQLTE